MSDRPEAAKPDDRFESMGIAATSVAELESQRASGWNSGGAYAASLTIHLPQQPEAQVAAGRSDWAPRSRAAHPVSSLGLRWLGNSQAPRLRMDQPIQLLQQGGRRSGEQLADPLVD